MEQMFYCEPCKQRAEKLKKKRSKSRSKKGGEEAIATTATTSSEIPLAQTNFRDKKVCNKCFCDSVTTRIRFTMQKVFKDYPMAAPVPVIVAVDDDHPARSLALYSIVHDSYPPEARRADYTTTPPRSFELIPVHVTIPGKVPNVHPGIPCVRESAFFSEFPGAAEILGSLEGGNRLTYLFVKRVLVRCALVFEARKAGALAVLTGETADDLSALVISDTAMGRGDKVATDTCVMDEKTFANVAVMRPLREFYAEETKKYISIKFEKVSGEKVSDDEKKKEVDDECDDEKDKTEVICGKFLRDMQGPFGHTMFTILGSIDRLEVGGKVQQQQQQQQCTVCRSFIAEIPDCESEESDLCCDFGAPLCRACGLMLKRLPDQDTAGRIIAFFESISKELNK